MNKKYRLTNFTKFVNGSNDNNYQMVNLKRIEALKSFGDVKQGDIGGWVGDESNLSHEGVSWVYGDAEVFGNAKVYDDAKIRDNARVSGFAQVLNESEVCGNARIYDQARICGKSKIADHVVVCDLASVINVDVRGNQKVCCSLLGVGPLKSEQKSLFNFNTYGQTNLSILEPSKIFPGNFIGDLDGTSNISSIQARFPILSALSTQSIASLLPSGLASSLDLNNTGIPLSNTHLNNNVNKPNSNS